MKRLFVKASFLIVLILLSTQPIILEQEIQAQSIQSHQVLQSLEALPLNFVENKGQLNEIVKYHLKMPNGNAYFTSNEIVYQFISWKDKKRTGKEGLFRWKREKSKKIKVNNIRVSFLGADEEVEVKGLEKSELKTSYFRGNDARKWVRGAPVYHKIIYEELYPYIDLIIWGTGGRIKHDYRVRIGGGVDKIRVRYMGIKRLSVNEKGELEIETEEAVLREDVPLSYQIIDGQRVEVDTRYVVDEDNTVRFKVEKYRKDKELIIDPTLIYSTYLGGDDWDRVDGVVFDKSGNVYVTGSTASSNFPVTTGVYDTSNNGYRDVFLTKISSSGTSLLYSTYLGGWNTDWTSRIAIDKDGNAYITGMTYSTDFPTTTGAYDISHNGNMDAFVTKINSTGTNLLYSTFLGGSEDEEGYSIAVDNSSNAYITGYTKSHDFPTTFIDYDVSYNGDTDAFITKINSSGTNLLYSTYLGGNYWDKGYELAIDANGNAYVTGYTYSIDFPTTSGAFDTSYNGDWDVFIIKINSTGRSLLYSTYLGGSNQDYGCGIAIDVSGNAFVTGDTSSQNFPTTSGVYDTNYNWNHDAFIAKLNSTGTSLIYSTYLGGSDWDHSRGITINGNGNAYVIGFTISVDFPTTTSSYDSDHNGSYDVFISKIDSAGSNLLYSTFLGGSDYDVGWAINADSNGNAYVTGFTYSIDFPTTSGAYDRSFNLGSYDGFVAKFSILSLIISTGIGGITSPSSGIYAYSYGTNVEITAIPEMHYKFNGWTGFVLDVKKKDNPLTTTMDSDKSVMANFIRIIYAPNDFSGQKVLNRSLSQAEYINVLTWHPNQNNVNIAKYRIYQVEGEAQNQLIELNANTFKCWHRRVEKDKQYTYALVAVNDEGREGDPAYITVQ